MALCTLGVTSAMRRSGKIYSRFYALPSRVWRLTAHCRLSAVAAGQWGSTPCPQHSPCAVFSTSPQSGEKSLPEAEANVMGQRLPSAVAMVGTSHSTVTGSGTGKAISRKDDELRATYTGSEAPKTASNNQADIATIATSVRDKPRPTGVQALPKLVPKPKKPKHHRINSVAERSARTGVASVPDSLENEQKEIVGNRNQKDRECRLVKPIAAVTSMLHASIHRCSFARFEHGDMSISVDLRDMTEIVDLLISQGVSVDAIAAAASHLFVHPCKDVRLAVALLVLEERPITVANLKVLLGERRGAETGFLSERGVAASYRYWREGLPKAVLQRMLADETGIDVAALDGVLPWQGQDLVGLLDKIHLLKLQPDVQTASAHDIAAHAGIFESAIEHIAAAVVQLRKANVSPMTLMQVYTMITQRRITSSSTTQTVADRQKELANAFGCEVASVPMASQAVWDIHAVSVSDIQKRVSQLAAIGVRPLDVLHVPHILAFGSAEIAAAVSQVDSLPAEKREALKSDSFKFVNALLYFADKVNLFQVIRSCDDFFKNRKIRKK